MIKEYFRELPLLKQKILQLDKKAVIIFMSAAVITYLSMEFAAPGFYYEQFGRDRFMSRVYWFLADGFLLFVIPALIIKLAFKEKISDYGFQKGDVRFGLFSVALSLAVMLPIIWVASASQEFAFAYPQGGSYVSHSMETFILYELCILFYMLGWEFFFRGFMLFGLFPKFNYYSVFIQMIPFFILHKGKPELEVLGSIAAGIILAIQALRANSFIYCWFVHWLVMLSIDSISVYRAANQFYSIF